MKQTMLCILACVSIFQNLAASTDSVWLSIRLSYQNRTVQLDEPSDSLLLTTARFYLSAFEFYNNNRLVHQEQTYHLIDLEQPNTCVLKFNAPGMKGVDEIRFRLGVDSLANVSGALGGALDPTLGMYWAWNSGYINVKLEGQYSKSDARNQTFEFHLGGYLPPYPTLQYIQTKANHSGDHLLLNLELSNLIQQVNWKDTHHIMSPGAEAVRLSVILASSFSLSVISP
ncbi:MAG: hypothetical protein JNJ57_04130 [Saprospiraceae bacterium]|nr:hypothetical protein [Saprospiraceae bacterium]